MLRDADVEVDEVYGAAVGDGLDDGDVGGVEGEAEAGRDVVEELGSGAVLAAAEVGDVLGRGGGRGRNARGQGGHHHGQQPVFRVTARVNGAFESRQMGGGCFEITVGHGDRCFGEQLT